MISPNDIALARALVAAGIPVIVVGPDDKPRQAGWQTMTAELSALDRYHEGDALAMVTGHGLDGVDVDTAKGGHLDWEFTSWGRTETPSGGYHLIVASTGIGSAPLPGIGDYRGGHADGSGRGLLFLPGSARTKYPDGGYTTDGWDIDSALLVGADLRLRERLLAAGLTIDRPRRELAVTPTRQDRGMHPEAEARRTEQLDRLRELSEKGWDGPGWDDTTYRVACNLIELSNAPWSGYPLEQAEADLIELAPRDPDFQLDRIMRKWNSALDKVGDGVADLVPADQEFTVEDRAPDRTSLEDADLAGRIVIEHLGGDLIAWGKTGWARWDGRRWDTTTTDDLAMGVITRALEEVFWSELAKAERDKDRLIARGADPAAAVKVYGKRVAALAKLRSVAKIKTVTAATRALIARSLEDFDGPATGLWLNVGNGVVDLRDGKLHRHDRALLFTKLTKVDYIPGARSADWEKALCALPPEVAEWMRLRFGQAATGGPPLDTIVPFLKGGGENGKSTLLDAVSAALGEFAHMASEKVVLGQNNEHSTETFALKGRRLVYIEELPEGNWVNMTRIKKLSGTGRMNARPMRENPVEWEPTHTLMITTNHDTQVSDTDHATWRRLARVEFPYTFTGEQRDRTLRVRVQQGEAVRAVLAWIISGAVDVYRAHGEMPMPAVVAADTEAWRLQANLPAEFIGDCLELRDGAAIPSEFVFRLWQKWAKDKGHTGRMNDQTFWGRAEQHHWFSKGVTRSSVRPGGYEWPESLEPKGKTRAVLGLTLSDAGETIRRRMDLFM